MFGSKTRDSQKTTQFGTKGGGSTLSFLQMRKLECWNAGIPITLIALCNFPE